VSKPVEEMSWKEIEAERAAIQREREALAAEAAKADSVSDLARTLAESAPNNTVRELYESMAEDMEAVEKTGGYVVPKDHDMIDAAGLPGFVAPDIMATPVDGAALPEPEAWPHDRLTHCGLELEVRIPTQSALMAISMLQQLDGMAALQMEIFNEFIANHLSSRSLAKVITEFTRPDTAMTMQSLIQALVNLRIEAAENS
jgi:hypothetical protein